MEFKSQTQSTYEEIRQSLSETADKGAAARSHSSPPRAHNNDLPAPKTPGTSKIDAQFEGKWAAMEAQAVGRLDGRHPRPTAAVSQSPAHRIGSSSLPHRDADQGDPSLLPPQLGNSANPGKSPQRRRLQDSGHGGGRGAPIEHQHTVASDIIRGQASEQKSYLNKPSPLPGRDRSSQRGPKLLSKSPSRGTATNSDLATLRASREALRESRAAMSQFEGKDRNKDGAMMSQFDAMDRNNDGVVDRDEFRAYVENQENVVAQRSSGTTVNSALSGSAALQRKGVSAVRAAPEVSVSRVGPEPQVIMPHEASSSLSGHHNESGYNNERQYYNFEAGASPIATPTASPAFMLSMAPDPEFEQQWVSMAEAASEFRDFEEYKANIEAQIKKSKLSSPAQHEMTAAELKATQLTKQVEHATRTVTLQQETEVSWRYGQYNLRAQRVAIWQWRKWCSLRMMDEAMLDCVQHAMLSKVLQKMRDCMSQWRDLTAWQVAKASDKVEKATVWNQTMLLSSALFTWRKGTEAMSQAEFRSNQGDHALLANRWGLWRFNYQLECLNLMGSIAKRFTSPQYFVCFFIS